MKKLMFIVAFIACLQSSFSDTKFGVKLGYNSSLGLGNLSSVVTGEYNLNNVQAELSNNFQAGVFLRYSSENNKKLYFQPELLYSIGKKDYSINFIDLSNNNVTYDKFVNISTVDIPLLIGYKIIDLGILNLRAFAGPKLKLNAGSTMSFQNIIGGGFSASDLVQDIKKSQIGLEAGVGIDVLMFTLDARYNLIGDMYQTKLNSKTIDNIPASTFIISLGMTL
jgi:hypothetical protein